MKIARADIAVALKKAAAFYLSRYGFSVTFELGVMPWGARRADIVANKINGKIVILEVKSSLADFRTDKKWRAYLEFCDKFLFCTTEAVYAKIKDELPKEVGVICLSTATGYAYVAKRCPVLDLSDENRLTVLARLAWRHGDLSKRTNRARQRVFVEDDTTFADARPVPKAKVSPRKARGYANKRKKWAKRTSSDKKAVTNLENALSRLLGKED